MGLSSFFNPDILIGMGQARQKERENLLSQEADRRKQGIETIKHVMTLPGWTDEAKEVMMNKIITGVMLKPGDKEPKGLFGFDDVLNVRPKVGASIKPTDDFNASNPGVTRESMMPLPDMPEMLPPGVQGPTRQSTSPSSVRMQTTGVPFNVSHSMRAPAPPPGYTIPGMKSQRQIEQEGVNKIEREEAVRTRADLERTRGRRQIELDMPEPLPAPKPLEDFTLSQGQSRFNPDGTVKASVAAAPPSADNSLTETELAMKAAGGDPLAKKAWDLIQQAKQSGEANRGEQGTYFLLTDMGGQAIGAWNPKAGNFVPAPQSGLRRGPAPASVNTQLTEYENSVRKLDELAAAYKPEFVGPYQGRYESSKATGVLSYLPFLKTPEGYGDFMALNADLKNTIIKLITGAQMGVQEAERILRQVPVETDKDENWKSKFTKTQENAKFLLEKIKSRYAVSPPLNGLTPPPAAGGPDGQWRIIDVK